MVNRICEAESKRSQRYREVELNNGARVCGIL